MGIANFSSIYQICFLIASIVNILAIVYFSISFGKSLNVSWKNIQTYILKPFLHIFKVFFKNIKNTVLKIVVFFKEINSTKILVISGFFLTLPFMLVIYYVVNNKYSIENILLKSWDLIKEIFNFDNSLVVVYTIILFFMLFIFVILPVINKDSRNFFIKVEPKISDLKRKLIALAIYFFCLSLFFALFYPFLSSLFLAMSIIIGFFLYMSGLYYSLNFDYNIQASIKIIEGFYNTGKKREMSNLSKHLTRILDDIDMYLYPKMKINNIKTDLYSGSSNKNILRIYLPLYVKYGTSHQQQILVRDLKYISNLFSNKTDDNMLLVRNKIHFFLNHIEEFTKNNKIEIKEKNALKDVLKVRFGTDNVIVSAFIAVILLVLFVLTILLQSETIIDLILNISNTS